MVSEPPWSEDRSTAVHEAGHAVASWLLGQRFLSVTVIAEEDRAGFMRPAIPKWYLAHGEWDELTLRQRDWLEKSLVILMAGEISQRAYEARHSAELPADREDDYIVTCAHDRRSVVDLLYVLDGAPEPELSAYWEWLHQRTISLVANFRFAPACEALADELQRVGTLSWRKAKPVMSLAVPGSRTMTVTDGQIQIV